jgi:hypothetical protein
MAAGSTSPAAGDGLSAGEPDACPAEILDARISRSARACTPEPAKATAARAGQELKIRQRDSLVMGR